MRTPPTSSLLTLLLAAWLTNASFAQTLHTSNQILESARLQRLDASGEAIFELEGDHQPSTARPKTLTVQLDDIVSWGGLPLADSAAVWLDDGSWLAGTISLEKSRILIVGRWLAEQAIPYRQARGLMLHRPAGARNCERLIHEMEATSGDRDVIWLRDGRQVSGILTVDQDGGEQAHFVITTTGDAGERSQTRIEPQNVSALVFSPTLLPPIDAVSSRFVVGLSDGTYIHASAMEVTGKEVNIQAAGGLRLSSIDTSDELCKQITYLAGRPAGVSLLQDLTPAHYKQTGQSLLSWKLGVGRLPNGERLRNLQGWLHIGLGMHGPCQVAYRPTGKEKRFLCTLQMAYSNDHEQAGLGDAVCEVLVVREKALEKIGEFAISRTRNTESNEAAEMHVDVDVRGAQLIVLVVQAGRLGEYGDQVQWLAARFSSTTPNPMQ